MLAVSSDVNFQQFHGDYVASPHAHAARSAVDSFLSLLSTDWSVTSYSNGVQLATSKCGAFLGRCVLPPSISLASLKALLTDEKMRHVIDDSLEEVELLEDYPAESDVINLQYLGYKRTLMVSGREFLVVSCIHDLCASSFLVVSTSVEDLRYPVARKGRIRGFVKLGGFSAKQVATGIELTMISQVDLGGQLPDFLTLPIQRQKPAEFLRKIKVKLSV